MSPITNTSGITCKYTNGPVSLEFSADAETAKGIVGILTSAMSQPTPALLSCPIPGPSASRGPARAPHDTIANCIAQYNQQHPVDGTDGTNLGRSLFSMFAMSAPFNGLLNGVNQTAYAGHTGCAGYGDYAGSTGCFVPPSNIGATGTTGLPHEHRPNGITGLVGMTGVMGPVGMAGPSGSSVYTRPVDAGATGTALTSCLSSVNSCGCSEESHRRPPSDNTPATPEAKQGPPSNAELTAMFRSLSEIIARM